MIFEVSAPIFDTFEHIVFEKGKNYYGHFAGEQDENKRFDRIRDYHLNYKIPLHDERDFALRISRGEPFSNQKVIVYTDKLYSERLTGYRGPCLLYPSPKIILRERLHLCDLVRLRRARGSLAQRRKIGGKSPKYLFHL